MRDATTGMTKLCGSSAPASVYTTLQQVNAPGHLVCTCSPVPPRALPLCSSASRLANIQVQWAMMTRFENG